MSVLEHVLFAAEALVKTIWDVLPHPSLRLRAVVGGEKDPVGAVGVKSVQIPAFNALFLMTTEALISSADFPASVEWTLLAGSGPGVALTTFIPNGPCCRSSYH